MILFYGQMAHVTQDLYLEWLMACESLEIPSITFGKAVTPFNARVTFSRFLWYILQATICYMALAPMLITFV